MDCLEGKLKPETPLIHGKNQGFFSAPDFPFTQPWINVAGRQVAMPSNSGTQFLKRLRRHCSGAQWYFRT